jgi:hypothetical protein
MIGPRWYTFLQNLSVPKFVKYVQYEHNLTTQLICYKSQQLLKLNGFKSVEPYNREGSKNSRFENL